MEEMQWNVSEYPDSNVIEKTEDINFNWNADPKNVPEKPSMRTVVRPRPKEAPKQSADRKSPEGIRVSEIFDRVVPTEEARVAVEESAKDEQRGLGEFYTIQEKKAEFQELLAREREKINASGTIGSEQSQADAIARERFDSRQEEMTMDQFLEREGAVKLYEPKPLQSDVLARIEAQEKQRARQKAEEEARAKALEVARVKAEAQKKAEIARLNSEAEASAAAAEEIRLAEEEEIRRRTEEEARRKAAAEAARLEAIASRQAAQEQAALQAEELRRAEEARLRAEAEAAAAAEAEARRKAEAEAAAAEEAARQKAEAELNAAREAARIRVQQEASLAAKEEAQFRKEQERRRLEEERLRQKQALRERQQGSMSSPAAKEAQVMEAQVKDALAQTARMREEEEAKIKAALAGIRNGRFSDTLTAGEAGVSPQQNVQTQPVVIPGAQKPAFEPQAKAGETVRTAPDEIEAAHRATQQQIDEMARARQSFFEDFPDAKRVMNQPAASAEDLGHTRMVSKDGLLADIDSTKKISREELHLDEDRNFFDQLEAALPAASAGAAAAGIAAAPAAAAPEYPAAAAPEYPAAQEAPEYQAAQAVPAAPVASEYPAAPDYPAAPEYPAAPAEPVIPAPAQPIEQEAPQSEVDDLLSQFASIGAQAQAPAAPAEPEYTAAQAPAIPEYTAAPAAAATPEYPAAPDYPAAPAAPAEPVIPAAPEFVQPQQRAPQAEEPARGGFEDILPQELTDEATPAFAQPRQEETSGKPGLQDTMVMAMPRQQIQDAAEASDAGGITESVAAMAQQSRTGQLSPKEQKKRNKEKEKEAKRLAREQKRAAKAAVAEDTFGEGGDIYAEEDEPKKGGVGRTILMIILIILCIIFALELAGIGIKLLAPTSGAAEFIDNILNSLIHMITGSSSGSGLA